MKGIYKVQKDNLNPLHREEKTIVSQVQSFSINYHANIKRMATNIVSRAVSTISGAVQDDFLSTSIPTKVIDENHYISPMCGSFLIMIVVVSLMSWYFHGPY